ncbi:unnamed protein product, partial [Brassica oleracea var. botrytis]
LFRLILTGSGSYRISLIDLYISTTLTHVVYKTSRVLVVFYFVCNKLIT